MAKQKSRPKRWEEAASKASDLAAQLADALGELYDIQQEYQEWLDNLPENLQGSSLADKLQAVCDIDIESQVSSAEETQGIADEALGADLPLGFGRD